MTTGSLTLQDDGVPIRAKVYRHAPWTAIAGTEYPGKTLAHVDLGHGWSVVMSVGRAAELRDALTAALDAEPEVHP